MSSALLKNEGLAGRLPAPDEVENAKELQILMEPFAKRRRSGEISVSYGGGKPESFHLSPAVAQTLVHVLEQFAAGRAVTLVPIGATLTTQQAADILNVSRPYLIKLLEAGEIAFDRVGRHRRISSAALLAYRKKRDETRRTTLAEMAADDFAAGDI